MDFGIADYVFFTFVVLASLAGGFFHTYLVTRRRSPSKGPGISGANTPGVNTPESCNGNPAKRESRDEHAICAGSFQTEDSLFQEAGRSLSRLKAAQKPHGLTLLSRNNRGISKLSDIFYLVTCYSSVCVVLGFTTHVYDHGPAFVLASVPAMLIAHLVAVGIINPVIYKYNGQYSDSRTRFRGNSNLLTLLNYIDKRFGRQRKNASTPALTFVAATCAISLWLIFTVSNSHFFIKLLRRESRQIERLADSNQTIFFIRGFPLNNHSAHLFLVGFC